MSEDTDVTEQHMTKYEMEPFNKAVEGLVLIL